VINDAYPFIWWLYDAARVLKPDGSLACFCRWDVLNAWDKAITYAGLKMRSCIIWDKGTHGMGNTKQAFAPMHELCLFATHADFAFKSGRPRDIILAPKVGTNRMLHPTEKPVELFEKLIKATTLPGALVADPFAGSGTTAVACMRSDRDYICIEIDPGYVDTARKRVQKEWESRSAAT
jgi:site-specific DNA-methyltransferase (adenine-specific)